MNFPKVLIIGTVPYNNQSPSRAFNSYFYGWNSRCLAQIFSNPSIPKKGHCGTLYQITDAMVLRRFLGKKIEIGKIYNQEELDNNVDSMTFLKDNKIIDFLHKFGARKSSMTYLMRKMIWKKKFWCTEKLLKWLDSFQPEVIFLAFSDDFFILDIAMFVAERYKIPIISCIGDDYYFNYKYSISPLYHVYKLKYRKEVRKVFGFPGSAIYIGNKIRDKYNSEFNLNGKTVYLTSNMERRAFKAINSNNPIISYFGNIRLGRNESLSQIADALAKINSEYLIHVYSGEKDEKFTKILAQNTHVLLHDAISYSEVMKKTKESDIILLPEGFKKKDVDLSRYSLSTKVADALASGVCIFAYGSIECGAIEYAKETGCITTCTNGTEIVSSLRRLIMDEEYQYQCYERSKKIVEKNHCINHSTHIFRQLVEREVRANRNVEK